MVSFGSAIALNCRTPADRRFVQGFVGDHAGWGPNSPLAWKTCVASWREHALDYSKINLVLRSRDGFGLDRLMWRHRGRVSLSFTSYCIHVSTQLISRWAHTSGQPLYGSWSGMGVGCKACFKRHARWLMKRRLYWPRKFANHPRSLLRRKVGCGRGLPFYNVEWSVLTRVAHLHEDTRIEPQRFGHDSSRQP